MIRDRAVERLRPLERCPRPPGCSRRMPRLGEIPTGRIRDRRAQDPMCAHPLETAARRRALVATRADDTSDFGIDQRTCARRGLAGVIAGLKRDPCCRTMRREPVRSRGCERTNLRVRLAETPVVPDPEDFTVLGADDATDHRVRRHMPPAPYPRARRHGQHPPIQCVIGTRSHARRTTRSRSNPRGDIASTSEIQRFASEP